MIELEYVLYKAKKGTALKFFPTLNTHHQLCFLCFMSIVANINSC